MARSAAPNGPRQARSTCRIGRNRAEDVAWAITKSSSAATSCQCGAGMSSALSILILTRNNSAPGMNPGCVSAMRRSDMEMRCIWFDGQKIGASLSVDTRTIKRCVLIVHGAVIIRNRCVGCCDKAHVLKLMSTPARNGSVPNVKTLRR